jgi:YihY family inner membrane protein
MKEVVNAFRRLLGKADAYQREHAWLGFPIAVFKKFGEDRAGQLAALVAYYGFFSLFPLMLALVTILGLTLEGNPGLRGAILDSALAHFPVIGDQIRDNIRALQGTGVALVIGIGGALWSGLAGIKAAQNGMDAIWHVPVKRQPSFPVAILRAVAMLATLGLFLLLAGFLGGVAAGTETRATWLQVLGVAGSFLLNFLVFWVAFRVLTVADVSWGEVFPGALAAAALWSALQALGGYIIGHRLESASQVYGVFAVVIGLLTWLYLAAQVVLLTAEVNVVRAKRLWPRGLDPEALTEADRRALRQVAEAQERREEQDVRVRFRDGGEGEPGTEPKPFHRRRLEGKREEARRRAEEHARRSRLP